MPRKRREGFPLGIGGALAIRSQVREADSGYPSPVRWVRRRIAFLPPQQSDLAASGKNGGNGMHLTIIPDHVQEFRRSFAGMSASPSSPARLPGGVRPRANMHGTTWRGAAEDDRSDPDAAKTGMPMLARPALVECPVIDEGETVRIGRRQIRIACGVPRIRRSPPHRLFSLRFRAMLSHRPVRVGEPDPRYE